MSLVFKNLLLFKAGWVACVVGAANGMAWLGALAVLAISLEHLRTATAPGRELRLLGVAAAVGLTWETALVSAGVLDYGAAQPVAPYWIVALWVLFATTLNVGMAWLKRHWLIAALAGALGGPLSFFSGERIGAVAFGQDTVSLVVIGLGWAMLMPLLTAAAARLDGHGRLLPVINQGG